MKSKKPSVLITGSVSLIGSYLIRALAQEYKLHVTAFKTKLASDVEKLTGTVDECDLTEQNQIKTLIQKYQPQMVIHLAGMSDIDECERHPRTAWDANVLATKHICDSIPKTTQLVFFSTSMVFSGLQAPYAETDKPHPINTYGKQKCEAEQLVQKHGGPFLIIRPSTVLGWPPKNARVSNLPYYLKRLRQKQPIYLVTDRFFNPVSGYFLGKVVKQALIEKLTGYLHIGGSDRVSRFTLVQKMAEAFGITPPQLVPVAHDYFPKLAARPADITLKSERLGKELKLKPGSLIEELKQLKNGVGVFGTNDFT